MKKILFTLSCLIAVFSNAQDTVVVQTFTYDSISTRRAIFSFPQELESMQFEKVLMYYNIKCDPLTPWDSYNCGEWDYLAHSKIYDHTGVYDSVLVESPRYKVNDENVSTVEYVNQGYYHYYESYEHFTTYTGADNNFNVGSGTNDLAHPFGTSNNTQRTQILYPLNELITAGLLAGDIYKLRFDVSNLGNVGMGHLTIKMKTTSAIEVTAFDETGWTTVYDRNTSFGSAGVNTIDLTSPFQYDGLSGILIDISWENFTAGTDYTCVGSNTTVNTVAFTNEKLGYLNIPQGEWAELALSDYDFQDEITISFWAYGDPGALPSNTSVLEARDSVNNRILNIHFPWSNSEHYWDAGEGSGYDRINAPGSGGEISGEWHHWAFTKNTTTGEMKIYKDGSVWLSGTNKNREVGIINKFRIGSSVAGGYLWAGKIDEFRVWDVELGQTEIAGWMNQKLNATHPNYADLILYYDFDGEQAIVDKSGSDYDAMMTNPGMINFYEESQTGINLTDQRPNITFVQGTYTSQLDSVLIVDSVLVDPIDVLEYQVSGRKFTVADIQHVYPAGYSYIYDYLGNATDSVYHGPDVSITNDTIFYYEEPFEIIDPFEIGRYITPYGIGFDLGPNGFTYIYDVTDYHSLLMGEVDFSAHNTQELIDVKFLFIEGTPPRDVISVEKLWDGHASHTYADLDNDVKLSAVNVDLNPSGAMYKVRTRITGHGHYGSNNCCEWGFGQGRDHELLIDGVSRFTWDIWQETECGDNPNISQGGTWPYAREGWCPGDIVEEHSFDITPFVSPGTTVSIDYDIEDVPTSDPDQGNGNYNMAMHLVTYGAPNFQTDAAIIGVLNPNDWEYYSKWNPTCQNPRVILKNTGAQTLTSCFIHVWIGGFDNVIAFEWTGNLEFLEEEIVEIPVTSEWWGDWQGMTTFSAYVHEPNGTQDEYANNDLYTVDFEPAPSVNEPFYIWFKTNNKASENELYLKNDQGDVIFSRTNLTNSTEYKDTFDLEPGCYTLELFDSDHDGLGFWYSNQVEGETTGYLRLRYVGGSMFHNADVDFGRYTSYTFSVGYAVGIDEKKDDFNLSIYPNPSSGLVNLTLDNFNGESVKIEIYNELGQLVYLEDIGNSAASGFYQHAMDLSYLERGFYIVRIASEDRTVTRRLVLN